MAHKNHKRMVVAPTRSGAQITVSDTVKHLAQNLTSELKRRRVDARLGLESGSAQHPKANINIWTGSKPAHFAVEISEAKGYQWSIRGYGHMHQLGLDAPLGDVADCVMQCFGRQCTVVPELEASRTDLPGAGA